MPFLWLGMGGRIGPIDNLISIPWLLRLRRSKMAWKCENCGQSNQSDNLDFPIMHEMMNDGHKVVPDLKTAVRWVSNLGPSRKVE